MSPGDGACWRYARNKRSYGDWPTYWIHKHRSVFLYEWLFLSQKRLYIKILYYYYFSNVPLNLSSWVNFLSHDTYGVSSLTRLISIHSLYSRAGIEECKQELVKINFVFYFFGNHYLRAARPQILLYYSIVDLEVISLDGH